MTTPREKSFLSPASHSGAPPYRSPVLLFLFWTVHGPFSLFLLEEKEKMGGAKHQPSSWLISSPARKGENQPLPWQGPIPIHFSLPFPLIYAMLRKIQSKEWIPPSLGKQRSHTNQRAIPAAAPRHRRTASLLTITSPPDRRRKGAITYEHLHFQTPRRLLYGDAS